MYNDLISQVKSDISELRNIQQAIEYLDNKRYQLERMKYEMESALADASSEPERSVQEIESSEAVKILKQYALRAIRDTVEFNIGEYRNRLISAIEDPRTIRIYYDNRSGDVTVRINLDRTAGTLRDYAAGVTKTRRILKIGPYKPTPLPADLASFIWMEKYYKPAREGTEIPQPKRKERTSKRKERSDKKDERKYDTAKYIAAYKRTMRLRLANFGGVAPFWKIINDGSVELDSDYGGDGYPQIFPTHFVEKAKRAISASISKSFKNANSNIRYFKEHVTRIDNAIIYIDRMIVRLSQKVAETVTHSKDEKTITLSVVKKALGDRFGKADVRKVLDLIQGLQKGTVDPSSRVSLTKRGGETVRVRLKNIYREIQKYGEDL